VPEYLSPGVYVEEVPSSVQAIASNGTSTPGFIGVVPNIIPIPVKSHKYDPAKDYALPEDLIGGVPPEEFTGDPNDKEALGVIPSGGSNLPYAIQNFEVVANPGEVIFCANFGDFSKYFGNFSLNHEQNLLAHAVYGFFMNGGTKCFVVRMETLTPDAVDLALNRFEAVDDIAIVAAPGIVNEDAWEKIKAHCARMNDRFAILDIAEAPEAAVTELGDLNPNGLITADNKILPQNTKNAAVYFPWLQVVDPAMFTVDPKNVQKLGNKERSNAGRIYVPPSGHMAGVYARTDIERGVHKAPANTEVRGALGTRFKISKAYQDILNPVGVNCIRFMNGAYKVWGGRTIGGDSNGEWRYVNVRRTFINIMEDIDKGTQWVVFEPNTPDLWAKIVMNVSAYLTGRWRQGALFGTAAENAFFVKCDFETNPPDARELGQVHTVIGVAIVRPAEFVIFQISQMAQQA
jgi:hypothetical protein